MLPEQRLQTEDDNEKIKVVLRWPGLDFSPRTLTGTAWKQAMVDAGRVEATEDMFPPCKECGRKLGHKPGCGINVVPAALPFELPAFRK